MIQHLTFNKGRHTSVILVHGLFTGEGFWLDYLGYFKSFKIIILKIDYLTLQVSDISEAITTILESESSGQAEAMITHSLGSIVAEYADHNAIGHLFNIAPVVHARRTNRESFQEEIASYLGDKIHRKDIELQLGNADKLISDTNRKGLRTQQSSRATNFVPTQDDFFEYENNPKFQLFAGNHFQIEKALSKITKSLE